MRRPRTWTTNRPTGSFRQPDRFERIFNRLFPWAMAFGIGMALLGGTAMVLGVIWLWQEVVQ